ncbi:ATP-dependent RNA helicase HrpA [Dokdonella fugitiva]|uniref:ATP-dependent helicase HrpA n=1 Tax=Dokdonella fugitiva TaxID=328517 RepID=A0A4R2I3Z9_9GAMM|nr:ATP-dependent RNA helicase HrpA [Dokdonella fugitiva]TCO37205.1 ATP-dependent helicase HrpA [Dokdonella fugitiva]
MSDLKSLRDALDTVMARDAGRLLARWRRVSARPEERDVAALREAIAASAAERAARAARVPDIALDASLPISARADEIVALIRKHQVLVLAGETGSGKTTQLPKLCLAAGRGTAGLIGCTQPRRIAARSVARRVAAELGSEVGRLVGFQVRFADQVSDQTLVKFMTDGILLAETQGDPWLGAYDTIILDEAHERSLNIDFLLGYLKRLLAKRRDLKLVVTSATIDTARFARHFGDAPVVEVEGRTYPVEVRWRKWGQVHSSSDEPADRARSPKNEPDPISLAEQVVAVADEITREDPRGDVLVFLPGEREIRDVHLALSRRKYRETEVLALYARLSAAEQDRVFRPGPQRRIVLATNVAETSLTVPRIRYVIDAGTARVKRYSPRNQLERLHVEPISQAAADQRKGRCGRVGPGICYRLYDEQDYLQRARYTDPEILRSSLAGVILRMLALRLGDPADFPFVEAPSERAIGDGYRRLAELGAIEDAAMRTPAGADDRNAGHAPRAGRKQPGWRLTAIGQALARLPVDVSLGRMLVEAEKRGVLRELLVLASFLSVQDPRQRPAEARQQADAAHAQFADAKSDFNAVLRLWAAYGAAHEELTQSKLRDWCEARFLSFLRMREWRELHRQLLLAYATDGDRLADEGVAPASRPRGGPAGRAQGASPGSAPIDVEAATADRYEAVHRCLLSGWPTQVGRKDERGQYRGTRERKFSIFPGSALAKSAPQWLLAGQILDLQKVYAMSCAKVEPAWIEQQAAHLVRKSWRDAHWSRKRGAVVAHEQVTLFGLVLADQRTVMFGRQDPPLAHAIFAREALARCEIDARADFVRANARVLAQAREIEAKRRRSGLIRGEDELAAFFAGKLPADISTSAALDAWYRRATPTEQAALHWSLADVLAEEAGAGARDFPARLDVAGHALRLAYRFVPGDAADGVTLHVPLALVNAVPAARCEWLVPGLLAGKVAEAIRGLPKALRRNFVPAPDFARAFVEAEPPRDEPLYAVLARYLQRVTGVAVSATDFAGVELPAHLAMNFRIEDEQGRVLVESRDLAAIQAQWTGAARVAFSRRADVELTREDVTGFDLDDIPDSVVSSGGLTAFPALVDLGESVALRVFERRDEALMQHRRGVERLLRRALADRVRQAQRQLPLKNELLLRSGRFSFSASEGRGNRTGIADAVRADIVEGALREQLAAVDLDVRTRSAFATLRDALARGLFAAAVERLALAEAVLAALAELRPLLQPPLLGFARANYDDLEEQLGELLAPGFLRDVGSTRLAQFPRYLKAMRLRAERLRQDPARDQARMLAVQLYWRDYLKLRAAHADDARLDELRWLVEELRVSTFAQELRTAEPVSPKRLAKLVEALRGT